MTVDLIWNGGSFGTPSIGAEAPDGSIYAADFGKVMKYRSNGEIDSSFDSPVFYTIVGFYGERNYSKFFSLALEPDGKLLVTGDFHIVGEKRTSTVIRLNATGGIDKTFEVPHGSPGYSVARRRGGGFLVGTEMGIFPVETTWLPPPEGSIKALIRTSDGGLLAGGTFRSFGGLPFAGIVRLWDENLPLAFKAVSSTNGITLWLSGSQGSPVTIESSADLRNWIAVEQLPRFSGLLSNRVSTEGNVRQYFRAIQHSN